MIRVCGMAARRALVDRRAAAAVRSFDGVEYTGLAGDTVASALLANGVRTVATQR